MRALDTPEPTRTPGPERRDRAQAIIVAGFILAVGIVALVAILNTMIASTSLKDKTATRASSDVQEFRYVLSDGGVQGISAVNQRSAQDGLNHSQVNASYTAFAGALADRLQRRYGAKALVDVNFSQSQASVDSNFTNSWRIRKNRTTPFARAIRPPADLVFVIDSSGSMASNDPSRERVNASNDTVAALEEGDRAAVVDFDGDAGFNSSGLLMNLTPVNGPSHRNRDVINASLDRVDADGATYMGGGLREANREFREKGNDSAEPNVILLTDGYNTEGWLHFGDKFAYSCNVRTLTGGSEISTSPPFDDCAEDADWGWRHEWGYVYVDDSSLTIDDRWEHVCLADSWGNESCENDGDGDGVPDNLQSKLSGSSYDGDWRGFETNKSGGANWSLDNRSLDHANVTDELGGTVYTVGLGTSNASVAKDLLVRIANQTGGFYSLSEDTNLTDKFEVIYEAISEPRPIAANVTTTYSMPFNITSFNAAGNFSVKVVNSSDEDDVHWRMDVTNGTTFPENHVVVDNGSVVKYHNYTRFGGPPVDIDVLAHEINGQDADLLAGDVEDASDYSVVIESGFAANGTMDVRVDDDANATGLCGPPVGSVPCVGTTNQTVGAVHGANFTVSFENDRVTYNDTLELTAEEQLAAAELQGVPSNVGVGGSADQTPTITFETPMWDYQTFYPFDQNATDTWPDNQSFDASDHGHTAGMSPEPKRPRLSTSHAQRGNSYRFDANESIVDEDGWNDVPINGSWTVSLWIDSDNQNGTILDMRRGGRSYHLMLESNTLEWNYTDQSGTSVSLTHTDSLGWAGWTHVAATGRWNDGANHSQLFVNGSLEDTGSGFTAVGARPMQSPPKDDRLNATWIGNHSTSAPSFTQGYAGHIDEYRLYHENLSAVSTSQTVLTEDFDHSGGWPANWTNATGSYSQSDDVVGVNSNTSSSGGYSAFTCCDSDIIVESNRSLDLSGATSGTLSVWIRQGGSFSQGPDAGEDLEVQYYDGGSWQTLDTFSGGDADGTIYTPTYSLPTAALHNDLDVRFRQTGGSAKNNLAKFPREDFWHVDDVEVVSTTTESFPRKIRAEGITGHHDLRWESFDQDVDAGNLELTNVDAELNGGNITVRVESDIDGDDFPDNWSAPFNEIDLNGSGGPYDVPPGTHSNNLSVSNDKYRLRVSIKHPEATDAPKFYSADLRAP